MSGERFTKDSLRALNLVWNEKLPCYEKIKSIATSTTKITDIIPKEHSVAEQKTTHPNFSIFWKNLNLVQALEWSESNGYIFIPGHIPSSKNSRINFVTKTGKQMSLKSKSCTKYLKESSKYYEMFKPKFLKALEGKSLPYLITFKFIRGNKSSFDFINPLQTLQDAMVQHGWIKDDNADILLPVLRKYVYDKNLPGVLIKVL